MASVCKDWRRGAGSSQVSIAAVLAPCAWLTNAPSLLLCARPSRALVRHEFCCIARPSKRLPFYGPGLRAFAGLSHVDGSSRRGYNGSRFSRLSSGPECAICSVFLSRGLQAVWLFEMLERTPILLLICSSPRGAVLSYKPEVQGKANELCRFAVVKGAA